MQDDALPGDRLFQVKVTLLEVEDPDVWRRLIVPAGVHLDRLHNVLQAAMGWQDYHLPLLHAWAGHLFRPAGEVLDHLDEHPIGLRDLVGVSGRLVYTYDYGDDWQHELVIERELTAGADNGSTTCIEGRRSLPARGLRWPDRLRRRLPNPRRSGRRGVRQHRPLDGP